MLLFGFYLQIKWFLCEEHLRMTNYMTGKTIEANTVTVSARVRLLILPTKDSSDGMRWDVFSPYSHLTVHHARKVKLGQQVLHLVVLLAVLLHVSMVTGDVRPQHIPHQQGQAALLAVTVFLYNGIISILSSFCTLGCMDSISECKLFRWQRLEEIDVKVCLTFKMRPLAPALKLPVRKNTFTME